MKKYFVLALVLSCALASAAQARGSGGRGSFDSYSAPELYFPTTDDIKLDGKEGLEFKWRLTDIALTDCFELRLYKGYQTTQQNLISKQRYTVTEYPVKLPAKDFEINQAYTWCLIQVYSNGEKSDKSYSSFIIISK